MSIGFTPWQPILHGTTARGSGIAPAVLHPEGASASIQVLGCRAAPSSRAASAARRGAPPTIEQPERSTIGPRRRMQAVARAALEPRPGDPRDAWQGTRARLPRHL